jgi:putative CocE/NonD family hydrolase
MSDSCAGSDAWILTPDRYLAEHPPARTGFRRSSCYVAMRDGVRLAVDVHLPGDAAPGETFPTLAIFTPYYRRFAVKPGAPLATQDAPNCGHLRDFFVPRGYAVVIADVRGTGASFGARRSFRSPDERLDTRDIADWCMAQPWCSGRLGSTGISYVGAGADFLGTTGHPAVKAVMPTFSIWDTYDNHFYPGGVYMGSVARGYGEMCDALDLDQREALHRYAYFADPHFDGPAPVDDDPDGRLRAAAVAEHRANFDFVDLMSRLETRDARLSHDPAIGFPAMSPCSHAAEMHPALAHYGVSGWMDGAGYSNATAVRYRSIGERRKHVLLGPWDHGARTHVSPFRRAVAPEFPVLGEALRFFDHHLKGLPTGLEREQPVHYFTLAEEKWKAADTWPPPDARPRVLHFGAGGTLLGSPAAVAGIDRYRADFTLGSGSDTRHERIAGQPVERYYAHWQGRDATMLVYTSEPLDRATEVTGHPLVTLRIESDAPDGAFFVYLEDVEPDGTVRYVTEGCLRAMHRATVPAPPECRTIGPSRSYAKRDMQPLVAGEPADLAFSLLPVSWLFRAGHRLRIAIACADSDHYTRIPWGRTPTIGVHRGGAGASRIELPVRP